MISSIVRRRETAAIVYPSKDVVRYPSTVLYRAFEFVESFDELVTMGFETFSRYSVARDEPFHEPPVPPCASSSTALAWALALASPLVEPVVSRERSRPS